MCWVIPPDSRSTRLDLRMASSSVVFPWSTCPMIVTTGGRWVNSSGRAAASRRQDSSTGTMSRMMLRSLAREAAREGLRISVIARLYPLTASLSARSRGRILNRSARSLIVAPSRRRAWGRGRGAAGGGAAALRGTATGPAAGAAGAAGLGAGGGADTGAFAGAAGAAGLGVAALFFGAVPAAGGLETEGGGAGAAGLTAGGGEETGGVAAVLVFGFVVFFSLTGDSFEKINPAP